MSATGQRTRLDWARCLQRLVDVHDPIVLVVDRLSTLSPASLDAAFPPAEAKRLADRPKIHHAPKHGSWLTIAELELAVLQRQCPRRRFTTADDRTKLRRLYPAIHG